MNHEEAKERLSGIPVKSVWDESLVGWEAATKAQRENSATGLPQLIGEYDTIKGAVMVRLKSEKLQVWVISDGVYRWKTEKLKR